jgi:hypothetical protein
MIELKRYSCKGANSVMVRASYFKTVEPKTSATGIWREISAVGHLHIDRKLLLRHFH